MKLILKVLLLFVLCFQASKAQSVRIGKFYDHLPYSRGEVLCKANDKIYVGAGQTLFSFDLDDNSIDKFSKVNKLSDLGVSSLGFSSKYNTLIIGYSTGNIDLLINNQIINIPDIERTVIQGFKSINSIEIAEDFAYLSAGFGIVKLDIQRQEIKETFLIGDNASNVMVNDLTFYHDSIFAATNEGIYMADLNSSNLANFQNWTKLNSYQGQNFNQIESNDSIILMNISDGKFNGDTLVSYNGSIWENATYPGYAGSDVEGITFATDKWALAYTYSGAILEEDLSSQSKIYTYQIDGANVRPRQIIRGDGNEYWIADNESGLVKRKTAWTFELFTPSGPKYYESWNLDYHDEAIWVASGALTTSLKNNYARRGVYRFQNNNWTSFKGDGFDSLYDITTVEVNPYKPEEVYFGSWGKGLIKTLNGEVQNVYNSYNSGIQSLNAFVNHLIGGQRFDKNGVLWVTCSGAPGANVNNPLVAFDGENWYEYDLNNKLISNTNTGELLIDVNGYKWFASNDNGIFVFDENGTLSDEDDDRVALITTGDTKGNLPTKVVHTIAEDKDGQIWIGTDEGLTVINSTFGVFDGEVKAERIIIEQEGAFQYLLETEIIKTIKVDGGNRKWIGTTTGGAYLLSEDGQETIHHFTADNSPLLSNNIFDIEIFGSTGEVFFSTDRGIVSYVGDATDELEYTGPTYAYPNPVRPEYDGLIGIKGLAPNAEVKITDITGNVIYETMSEGTTATWDGNSLNGNRAQTGVYIVFSATDDGSQKEVAKILFIN